MYFFVTIIFFTIATIKIHAANVPNCGCHVMRPCYKEMLDNLIDRDEAACVEDAEISPSSIHIFLLALKKYCHDVVDFVEGSKTYESKSLYEVIVTKNQDLTLRTEDDNRNNEKPVIIIDAGQRAGKEPVEFAIYIIQQLTACMEYDRMIQTVKWVIMPCTNPDGLESTRFVKHAWYKNMRMLDDKVSNGVDISRNFDYQWGSCHPNPKPFSQEFPGSQAASEKETNFIKSVIKKHKNSAKAYISLRRDGHAILYPYGYSKEKPLQDSQIENVAGRISSKVNQKAGSVQVFANKSIFEMNAKPHCGNSVDYAYDCGIPLAYEMRVFLGDESDILAMFQPLPRGFEPSLRSGYFNGIRELYNVINEKKTKQTQSRLRSKNIMKHEFQSAGNQIFY